MINTFTVVLFVYKVKEIRIIIEKKINQPPF